MSPYSLRRIPIFDIDIVNNGVRDPMGAKISNGLYFGARNTMVGIGRVSRHVNGIAKTMKK